MSTPFFPPPYVPPNQNEGGGVPRWLWLLLGGFIVCGGIVPCVGIVAAIAIPNFITAQMKAKRAELPANVDSIKIAVLSYRATHDGTPACGTRAEAEGSVLYNGKEPRAWQGSACWTQIGWSPDGPVRGAYWIETAVGSADGQVTFEVHGVSDIDSDGTLAEYAASEDRNATMVTPQDAY